MPENREVGERPLGCGRQGDSEIEKFDRRRVALLRRFDKEISRFDVTVNDSLPVARGETIGRLL